MDGFNRASDVPPGEGALDPANPAHARSHEHALSAPPGAELAAWLLMARRLREEVLGAELFSDPAWDILLDVYAAEAKGGKIQISSLAPVNGVPSSTARRWAHKLIELGLLERERDDRDHRLSYIRLSRHGHERIVLFIKRLLAKGPPPPIER
jgi:DNA-binding MarR family transcriptional regulator